MIRAILRNAGISPRRMAAAIRGWRRYVANRRSFRERTTDEHPAWGAELPMLTEWDEAAGDPGAYFHQDRLVASWIYQAAPVRHVDVGSRIDGFIGSLSVFRKVEVIDIRPLPVRTPNVEFRQLDLTGDLPSEWLECTDSLSCLHTIEHFGLGRYGDPLDPSGHIKGLERLKSMVKPGGNLYLSTPIGPERVEFNAHRIFAPETVLSWFDTDWEIGKCALLDDDNRMAENAEPDDLKNFRGNMGLAIISAKKL